MGLLLMYLKEMSINPTLLFLASSTGPDQLFVPKLEAMRKLGIVNVLGKATFSGWKIEPYRLGAVVTGNLNGGLEEHKDITFYCKSDSPGRVFMLASWKYPSASAKQAVEDNRFIRQSVLGSTVLIGGTVVRKESGYDSIAKVGVNSADVYSLTYILTDQELERALASGSLTISISGPHALGDFGFWFSPPMADLAPAIRIAFKSCL